MSGGGGNKLDGVYGALVKTNSEIFRLSNDGRFPAKVSLSFKEQPKV